MPKARDCVPFVPCIMAKSISKKATVAKKGLTKKASPKKAAAKKAASAKKPATKKTTPKTRAVVKSTAAAKKAAPKKVAAPKKTVVRAAPKKLERRPPPSSRRGQSGSGEDPRTEDVRDKATALRTALERGDAQDLLEAASSAQLALAFRDSDAMIGLSPVRTELLDELEGLVVQALEAARERGGPTFALAGAQLLWRDRRQSTAAACARLVDAALGHDPFGEAAYLRALLSFWGHGADQSHADAILWHRRAAAAGHPEAAFELHAMYAQGIGTEPDPDESHGWLVRAADRGNARALANLGGMYFTGNVVERDVGKGISYYQRAAEAGHGRAAAVLGVVYARGDDVSPDDEKARTFFSLAEELGFDWETLAEAQGLKPERYVTN